MGSQVGQYSVYQVRIKVVRGPRLDNIQSIRLGTRKFVVPMICCFEKLKVLTSGAINYRNENCLFVYRTHIRSKQV